jgi:hypothetical protein
MVSVPTTTEPEPACDLVETETETDAPAEPRPRKRSRGAPLKLARGAVNVGPRRTLSSESMRTLAMYAQGLSFSDALAKSLGIVDEKANEKAAA